MIGHFCSEHSFDYNISRVKIVKCVPRRGYVYLDQEMPLNTRNKRTLLIKVPKLY